MTDYPIKISLGTGTAHYVSTESARKLVADIQQQLRVVEQQPPQESTGDVWLLVMQDMEARRKMGIEKYGKPVQPFNGRNTLRDLREELLDAVVYTKQFEEELKCLGTDLENLYAHLVKDGSPSMETIADAVVLLRQILSTNSALHAT